MIHIILLWYKYDVIIEIMLRSSVDPIFFVFGSEPPSAKLPLILAQTQLRLSYLYKPQTTLIKPISYLRYKPQCHDQQLTTKTIKVI